MWPSVHRERACTHLSFHRGFLTAFVDTKKPSQKAECSPLSANVPVDTFQSTAKTHRRRYRHTGAFSAAIAT